jgi:uncharacterized protein
VNFRIEWRQSTQAFPNIIWDEFFAPPREGRWWYESLERAGLEDQFTFLYAAVLTGNNELIAIIPAFVFDVPMELVAPPAIAKILRTLGHGPLRRLRYQRTLFIGSVAAEEGVIGLRAGCSLTDIVLPIHDAATREARQRGASMVVWKDFEQPDSPALDLLLQHRACFRVPSFPGTSMPLLQGGFDAHLATLKSSRRHQLKKKLKRGQSLGALRVEVLHHPPQAILDELFPLFWQTYEKGETKFERLTPRWFTEIAKHDPSYFVILRDVATDKAIAFMLCLRCGPRVINKFIGIDYRLDAGERFLYFQLFAAAYDWASTTGAQIFQSGQTGYRAKTDLGHSLVPLNNYCRHRFAPINKLFAKITSTVTWSTLDHDLAIFLEAHPELN